MAWIESPYRKKRRRYYNNKKAELERLNAKWTNEFRKLGFGNALDRASTAYQGGRTNGMLLSYYEIHNPAWNYAENKAASSLTWYQSLVSGNGVGAFVFLVLGFALLIVVYLKLTKIKEQKDERRSNFSKYWACKPCFCAWFDFMGDKFEFEKF